MTRAELIAEIRNFIRENGNNEITATVLRPVLLDIVDFLSEMVGDPQQLQTDAKESLISAINEINGRSGEDSGSVTLHFGSQSPEAVPPQNFKTGDLYRQVPPRGGYERLYQYNGRAWIEQTAPPAAADIADDVTERLAPTIAAQAGNIPMRVITSNAANQDIRQTDHYLSCRNTAEINLLLPDQGIKPGHTVMIKRLGNETRVRSVGRKIYAEGLRDVVYVSPGDLMLLVWDGDYWLYNWTGR